MLPLCSLPKTPTNSRKLSFAWPVSKALTKTSSSTTKVKRGTSFTCWTLVSPSASGTWNLVEKSSDYNVRKNLRYWLRLCAKPWSMPFVTVNTSAPMARWVLPFMKTGSKSSIQANSLQRFPPRTSSSPMSHTHTPRSWHNCFISATIWKNGARERNA